MKILIHDNGTDFPRRWVEYCREKQLDFNLINCFDNNIIQRLKRANILLWRWEHGNYSEILAAKEILSAAEMMGIKVFPDKYTCGTYDNKISQKYLLESIGAPLVPTYVFYDEKTAFEWARQTSYPKVFKLSKGAGSMNVQLVKSKSKAVHLIKKAFGEGFKPIGGRLKENIIKLQGAHTRKAVDIWGKLQRLPHTLLRIRKANRQIGREHGYVCFQDFVPNNTFDTRITVIGNRAFGFTRNVRKNDFRASGSGSIDYDINRIDPRCISIAFAVAKNLHAQSMAFDFVRNVDGNPVIVEISYAYKAEAVYNCSSHWDPQLNLKSGHVWPPDAILEDILQELTEKNK